MCSTPFGIRDHGGPSNNGTSESIISAQRLSASEIMAVRVGASNEMSYLCSTPFGIRDHGGAGHKYEQSLGFVLNAFRHQRSWRKVFSRT